MYGEKFYEKYAAARGLNEVWISELDKTTAALFFGFDYPQPMTGFYLSHFDECGGSAFKFVIVSGDLEYDSAGRPESIEYAVDTSSGLKFKRFYFDNPYGDRIYLIDK